jgi:pimeloyl-ACP methyl ester carboxylesterase
MRSDEWTTYYDTFDYFDAGAVRDGCHPRILTGSGSGRAVVLVHGLTDSPHYMTAIARHFHEKLGCDVYVPLLQGHGLTEPRGMEDVELDEWKTNVRYAVRCAGEGAESVSIGGLSTGGTLATYMALTSPFVTGDLYLFSAALDLAGGKLGILGEIKERLLRTFLVDVFDKDAPLVGENPYRYGRMDLDGARELSRLIKEVDDLVEGFDPNERRSMFGRVFAAHSEADTTADIAGIRKLERKLHADRFTSFYIPKSDNVSHASLVLDEPITDREGEVLEERNSQFCDMMGKLTEFVVAR